MWQLKNQGLIEHLVFSIYVSTTPGRNSYIKFGDYDDHSIKAGETLQMLQTNDIIAQMQGFALTPRQGTIFIGVWNFFCAVCSLYTGKAFSRRFLIAGGHTAIGVFLILFALLNQLGKPSWAFVTLLLYLLII